MFEDMVKSPAVWLSGKGEESAAVLSSRVRLARNIAGCKYPPSADSETGTRIVNYVDSTVSRSDLLGRGRYVRAGDISPLDRDFLVERHLISPAFLSGDLPKALYIGSQEQVSIMVNEEDHLRIQALASGLDPRGAYAAAKQYDQEIGRHLEYDYDPDFGFLTACPTNVGTGMRVSAMLHLPGLVLAEQINQVVQAVNKLGLAVRGLYGEGTEALGNIFQISNQMTLGETETVIVERLSKVVAQIIEHEENARGTLLEKKPKVVFNHIGRAYGILANAHSISSKEAMNLLSLLRVGLDLGLFPGTARSLVDELTILTQPAHLQSRYSEKLSAEERDIRRADMMREALRTVNRPVIPPGTAEPLDKPPSA